VVYQLDGLQVTLTAPPMVDKGAYALRFARWDYEGRSYYTPSISVSVPPGQAHTATAVYERALYLTIQVYAFSEFATSLSPASGVQVKIDDAVYTADANGIVRVEVDPRTHAVEILTTYFASGWARYRFFQWSDGSTQNPRAVNVSASTTLTAYAWDGRKLKVTWEPGGGHVRVVDFALDAPNGWECWLSRYARIRLQAVPATGYQFSARARGAARSAARESRSRFTAWRCPATRMST
jgi:hypothetical protein